MNILFVVEKPSIAKLFKQILNEHKTDFKDTYEFDYIRYTSHLDDNTLLFRKKDNEYYQMGKKSDFRPLTLNSIDIPTDTFLENYENTIAYQIKENINKFDKIVGICDADDYGKLAFAKYLEVHNIKYEDAFWTNLYNLSNDSIYKKLLEPFENFNTIFDLLKTNLIKNKFVSSNPRKKEIIYLRIESKMSRTEFANYFNIPYRTVENWEKNKSECSSYLYDLMEYKLEKEGKFYCLN